MSLLPPPRRAARPALLLLAAALVPGAGLLTGCYDRPMPDCAFLCGEEDACPEGYGCGVDGRCHRVLPGGSLAECEDSLGDAAPGPDAQVDGGGTDAGPDFDAGPDLDAGFDAAPPECEVPADCGTDTECVTFSCEAGACGSTFTAADTPVTTQTAGDCQVVVCDGAGGTGSNDDDNDVPADADTTDCEEPTCTGGAPATQFEDAGTPCGAGGAGLCDAAGTCIE